MRYDAHVTAYDCLDQIMVTAWVTVREDDPEAPSRTILRSTVNVQGTGEVEPARWLLDALVAVCETL